MSESFQLINAGPASDASEHLAAVRRSEERYRALIEATTQVVWSWAPGEAKNDFDRSRQWWLELTGQSLEEQQSHRDAWLAAVHPEDRSGVGRSWESAIAAGTTYDTKFRVRARQGGWRHVRVRGVPVRNPDGADREWGGTLDDVTAQHEAAAERDRLLTEAETERRRLEEVFQNAPSFIAVLREPDDILERVNDRYTELIGGRNVLGLPVRQALPEVEVTVRDTGIGIPAHALPNIFDMFSQVDRSIERSTGGLGIGLALVKGLVEMHGGSVTAQSVEGQGSTFIVRLPLAAPVQATYPAIAESSGTASTRCRVLVVDDNRDDAAVTR